MSSVDEKRKRWLSAIEDPAKGLKRYVLIEEKRPKQHSERAIKMEGAELSMSM